ncbi:MAG TPA: GGDEF domain-containing protein [Terracidiphilus sp.]|jgi:diguanylate cyclase (GGDEF)-like protein
MPLRVLNTHETNHDLLHSVFFIEQICLIVAVQIAFINLLTQIFTPFANWLPAGLLHMRTSSACAAFCASAALFLLESNRRKQLHLIGRLFAAATAIIAACAFWLYRFSPSASLAAGPPVQPAWLLSSHTAFLLLGLAIVFVDARNSLWSHIADALAAILGFLVLLLASECIYGLTQVPGSSIDLPVRLPTLACLILLTLTVILCRAEHGIFSLLLVGGIEGQFARILVPILISLPIIREVGRAHLLNSHLVPPRYATAILSSSATAISFVLLFALSRLITRMQSEVQQLNLRDELTGLYNFRGFNLLAEQAYRLAARSRQPFGVLFIDMDNLKVINDGMGHNVGSLFLVETAKLLISTFRETDVIGRLGGDEFVVAGQFDPEEIDGAIGRLRAVAASRNIIDGQTLSLSLGFAATEAHNEPLKAVVARADKAMYKEKREKKRALAR